jgi:hypothetical protein
MCHVFFPNKALSSSPGLENCLLALPEIIRQNLNLEMCSQAEAFQGTSNLVKRGQVSPETPCKT